MPFNSPLSSSSVLQVDPRSVRGNSTGQNFVRGKSFSALLDNLSGKQGLGITQDFNQLKSFESTIEAKREIPLKELLAFQVKAARFHLHVEACSKVADAAVSSVKRFQSMR